MIFDREGFEAFVSSLTATSLVHQWGDASVAKVGGKIYAILSWVDGAPSIRFKCSDIAFDMLPELDGCRPAPYLARAKWIATAPDGALSEDDIRSHIAEAHRLIAARLPRRMRDELGLADPATASRHRS